MKVYIENRQKSIKVDQRKVTGLLRKALFLVGLNRAELSIVFVSDRAMRVLNNHYRGIDKTTDVLSFPLLTLKEVKKLRAKTLAPCRKNQATELQFSECALALGDIVISLEKTKKQAAKYNVTFANELKRLLIHGLLHLMGYDHERSRYAERKMRGKESELLEQL